MDFLFFFNHSKNEFERKIFHRLNLFLLLCAIVLLFINIFTPILFMITNEMIYQRGELYLFYILLLLFLGLYAMYLSFVTSLSYQNGRRKEYQRLTLFGLILLLVTIVQGYYFGLSLVWITITIFLFILYQEQQNKEIYTDYFTKLNNRYALEVELEKKCKKKEEFMILLLDVNNFKFINDTYGHKIGDEALLHIVEVLKAIVPEDAFLARYAGDEFIILSTHSPIPKDFKIQLQVALEKRKEEYQLPYPLGVACGELVYKEGMSKEELLEKVDLKMYKVKK